MSQAGAAGIVPRRVLVVDDEPVLRGLVVRLLTLKARGRLETRAAGSAEEAVDLLASWPADLVLSDYRMPGRTGASLLAEVRERWPGTKRALMTGYQEIWEDAAGLDRADVAFVIAKPWRNDELVERVFGLLDAPPASA